MFIHVFFVVSMSIESLPTLLTIEPELSSMKLHVLVQAASSCETFTAFTAWKLFRSRCLDPGPLLIILQTPLFHTLKPILEYV